MRSPDAKPPSRQDSSSGGMDGGGVERGSVSPTFSISGIQAAVRGVQAAVSTAVSYRLPWIRGGREDSGGRESGAGGRGGEDGGKPTKVDDLGEEKTAPGGMDAGSAAPVWKFRQSFGERVAGEEVQDADLISALQFNATGSHLASGDRGGRVVLFQESVTDGPKVGMDERAPPGAHSKQNFFHYMTEFQSHETEFDYLKSIEIEEKINKIRWCHGNAGTLSLLTTNDKKIKLWKVFEHEVKMVGDFNTRPDMVSPMMAPSSPTPMGSPGSSPRPAARYGISGCRASVFPSSNETDRRRTSPNSRHAPAEEGERSSLSSLRDIRIPRCISKERVLSSRCRRTYGSAHAYHINSISLSSDGETFLSSDDLRINLWHFDIPTHGHHLVDLKPENMEDLTEVITCAEFHPKDCSTFCYSSSKGALRLLDMRATAVCRGHSKIFEEETTLQRTFLSEIVASISDFKFSNCGRYIVARDYMNLKIWDLHMEKAPLASFQVQEHLRPKLNELYENDCIFDKFSCCISGNAAYAATGTYSNTFRVFDIRNNIAQTLECSEHPQGSWGHGRGRSRAGLLRRGDPYRDLTVQGGNSFAGGPVDCNSKLLHVAWHPQEYVIAAATTNSLFLFNG